MTLPTPACHPLACRPLAYRHVDVFAQRPYAGNSLAVFADSGGLDVRQMLAITQELRHFEAVFLSPTGEPGRHGARIFDLFEELPFAGHPIVGAAAVLHEANGEGERAEWTFDLAQKSVTVVTTRTGTGFFGLLDQGPAEFLGEVADRDGVASAFGLGPGDLDASLPLAVVSTGLRYLIVPVRPGALERARIGVDISKLVQGVGAQFAVLLDEVALEVRHWNNDGVVEDVATGSAAGMIGAYRLRHCGAVSGQSFTLHQGRFAGRPSRLMVEPWGGGDQVSVKVGGDVAIVGRGWLEALP
ncbi:trans-2,3-dihydro-3-hydroxyanthranilate isomerase [Sphingomonas sp. UYAg733]